MENIIQQIVSEAVRKYLEYYEEHGIGSLSRMTEDFKQISDGMAKDLLSALIANVDEVICEAKALRKEDQIKVHERAVERTVFTALGPFTYERTYFDTPQGRAYLADRILGVDRYERIDAGVSARLVNTAATHSYGRSADMLTGGQISRQSVRNKVMNTGEVLHIPVSSEKTPHTLHIFADEDHVSLQSGRNCILPLVTVCEGKREESKGRNRLLNAFHIHGYGLKPQEHWEYVYALCAQKYDMQLVRQVYIYGDGATWIMKGLEVFGSAVHVLDEFHYKQRMKSLLAGEICAAYSLPVRGAVEKNDPQLFAKCILNMSAEVQDKMVPGKERRGREKAIRDNSWYILSHWDAVQNMKRTGTIGSCTEAMVSHVLSERFSRNPMGWSEAGLSKMAMIRVFVQNGGRIEPVDTLAGKYATGKNTVITCFKKYESMVKEQQEKILKDAKKWRWFQPENDLISAKRTGTRVILDAFAQTRRIS